MNAAPLASPRVGIDGLLARLERVHPSGQGWRADCPNGHRAHGTLSLAQADDGRILLHCFCGCRAADVLAALGMTLQDIMPARLRDTSPEGRRKAREGFKFASTAAAASVLAVEANIVHLAGFDLLRGHALPPDDVQRLRVAVERIASVREVLR